MPDARVQAAIDNWAPRFMRRGGPQRLQRTDARVERWDEWLDAFAALGDAMRAPRRPSDAAAADRRARRSCTPPLLPLREVRVGGRRGPRARRAAAVAALYAAHARSTAAERSKRRSTAAVVGNLRRRATGRPPLVVLIPGLDSTKEEFYRLETSSSRAGWRRCRSTARARARVASRSPSGPTTRSRSPRSSTSSPAATTSTSIASARRASASAATTRRARRRSSRASGGRRDQRPVQLRRATGTTSRSSRARRSEQVRRDGAEDGARAALELDLEGVARAARSCPPVRHRQARPPDPVDPPKAGAGGAARRVRRVRGRQPRLRERAVHRTARWSPTGCASSSDDGTRTLGRARAAAARGRPRAARRGRATSTTSTCPGMLHAAFVRSPFARAASAVRVPRSPRRAVSRRDLPGSLPGRRAAGHEIADAPHPILPDEVRYVGQPVAMVLAASPSGRGRGE